MSCKFIGSRFLSVPPQVKYLAALFSAGTGAETSVDMLFRFAKRIRKLEHVYDVRRGMTRDRDSLPIGLMDHPSEKGVCKDSVLKYGDLEKMKTQYYSLSGWDTAIGIPTREALVH